MADLFSIEVPAQWQRWEAGFADLPAQLGRHAAACWDTAAAGFYEASQELAHIDTGEMKASGHHHTAIDGATVVAQLIYDSDHAIFEQARGGDHAFISRAWELTEPLFADALPAAFEAVLASWK